MDFLFKIFLTFIIFLHQFNTVQPLFIYLDGQDKYCLYKDISQGEQLMISYVVSGEGENNVLFQVFEQDSTTTKAAQVWNQKPSHSMVGKREYEYISNTDANQEYKMCFTSLDGKTKVLSFDFSGIEREDNEITSYIEQFQLDYIDQRISILQYLKKSYHSLEKIFRNQHYQFVRDEVHKNKINQTSKKIQWSSVIKICILILICGFQIVSLISFFKKQSQPLPTSIPDTLIE